MYYHCTYERFKTIDDMNTALWIFLDDADELTHNQLEKELCAVVIHIREPVSTMSTGKAIHPTDVLPLGKVDDNIIFGDWNYENNRGIFKFMRDGVECHSIISNLTFDEYVSIMSGKPIPEDTFIPKRRKS